MMRVLPEKLGLTGEEALDVMDIKCSTELDISISPAAPSAAFHIPAAPLQSLHGQRTCRSRGIYLFQEEVQELNEIVTMYLDYATRQARRHIPMTMADWAAKLDAFIRWSK